MASDGSFDWVPEFVRPEKLAQLRRDAHEMAEHTKEVVYG